MRRHARTQVERARQQGAATLVVVMVLFLIMALLAAYANRSLMFEQRISGSYYRASLAQEMAEGGVDWTVAMLNGPATNTSCLPASTGGTRFVDRYLNVSPADRAITALSATPVTTLVADCVRGANGLTCRCPAVDTRTTQPDTVVTGNLVPSFGLKMVTDTLVRAGSFNIGTLGCSDSSVDNCNNQNAEARSQAAVGVVELRTTLAFVGAVPSVPASPLTVKGTLTTAGSGGLGLHNTDPATSGSLVVSGGPAPTLLDSRMDTIPGTPPAQARTFDDTQLAGMSNKQFFQTFMGMAPSRYRNHPALATVTCPASSDCGPALLAAYTAGQHMLWVEGALTISSNVAIGTADAPVVIIANGATTLTGPMQVTGLLASLGNLSWVNTGGLPAVITGMVLVQGDMAANGGMDIVYQQAVANQLRNRVGSYVRVSGGMRDVTIK